MKKLIFITLFSIIIFNIPFTAFSQRTYTNTSFRSIDKEKYFRFHYDNDFFTKYDQYYTQGITIEVVHPTLKLNPINFLLWKPFSSEVKYGISFNLFGYTPTSILSDNILYGDRPFDANISLKSFSIQIDEVHKRLLSSSFSIGVMGAAAKGYEIQYNIHKWLANPLPHGWQYQIKNDAIINYQLNYEKQLISKKYFTLNAVAEARAGTLNDCIAGGFSLMTGKFNNIFTNSKNQMHKTSYYFYLQNKVNFVAYDASMQGGIFNKNSPYTIANSDINRAVFQADAGVIIHFKKLILTYTQSYITQEFKEGTSHRWGGISVGFSL